MYKGKSILAIIPARGGSKGIPRKNIRNLLGKPLMVWTIEEAKKSKYIDRTIVSSDDNEIIEVAKSWGGDVPFKRPAELATDDSAGIDAILHVMRQCPEYDYVMMLQPTSPLRTVHDIDGCIEFYFEKKVDSCVSITEAESTPYWMYTLNEGCKIKSILPRATEKMYQRQKLPIVYRLNGALYMAEKNFLIKNKTFIADDTAGYIMPIERSVDIDRELDFNLVQTLFELRFKLDKI